MFLRTLIGFRIAATITPFCMLSVHVHSEE